jgi:hypothetical protein
MDRRRFLQLAAIAGLGTVANPGDPLAQYRFLDPVRVPNPLQQYPNRDWERIYRDIFRHDRTFTFLCAPNDTRVGSSGRHDREALHLPEIAVERGDEARVAVARYRDDRGVREAEAAVALRAEGLQDVEEHVRGGHELDVAGLEQDRRDPHGDVEPAAGEKHGDDLEEHVLEEEGWTPLGGHQPLHGGSRRAVMDVAPVVVGHEKAGVEDDHRWRSQPP